MPDEEINLRVNQTSSGNALDATAAKIEQLKARIAELNKLEASYAQKGITGTGDLRQERTALQRELTTLTRDQGTADRTAQAAAKQEVRERLQAERQITRETNTQAGARRRALGQVAGEAAGAAGIPGMGLIGGGVAGAAAIAIGAIIGKVIHDEIAAADTQAAQEGQRVGTFNRLRNIRGLDDSTRAEGLASGEFQSNRSELEAALAKRGTFANSGILDRILGGANNVLGTSFETSGARGARENEAQIARLQSEQGGVQQGAERAFRAGPGGDELRRREAVLAGHQKEAFALQYKIALEKEFHRVSEATGSSALGMDAADLLGRQTVRDRQMKIGQALVSGRSGAGDVAAAARFAGAGDATMNDVISEMRTQHGEQKTREQVRTFGGRAFYPNGR